MSVMCGKIIILRPTFWIKSMAAAIASILFRWLLLFTLSQLNITLCINCLFIKRYLPPNRKIFFILTNPDCTKSLCDGLSRLWCSFSCVTDKNKRIPQACLFQQSVGFSFLYIYTLHNTLCGHSICHFQKTSNICSCHVISFHAVLLGC